MYTFYKTLSFVKMSVRVLGVCPCLCVFVCASACVYVCSFFSFPYVCVAAAVYFFIHFLIRSRARSGALVASNRPPLLSSLSRGKKKNKIKEEKKEG